MVGNRETPSYQYSRIKRCFSCSTSFLEEQTLSNCVPQRGQLVCCCLHQSQGRNTLTPTTSTVSGALGLVHPEKYISHCTLRPREVEQPGRSRITGVYGQHRLDAGTQNNQTPIGKLPNRLICNETNSSTRYLCQLETGSQGSPLRCFQPELAGSTGIRFPTIQPDPQGAQQNTDRPNRNCSSSTDLASAALVASTSRITDPATSTAAGLTSFPDRPHGATSNPSDVPSSSLSRISYLLQRYKAEGFPTGVARLLIAATRSSTHKTYESSWKRWRSWCCTREIDPVSASLKDILTFLSDSFDSGLQYRSINVLRSALSVTHPKIDGFAVGQHPFVVNILRGILNERPPKPRYSSTWDVSTVTAYMVKMGDNSNLSLKQLSRKLATLFAITCPKRVSSLAHLDLNHYRLSPEDVTFTLVKTKTTRPDEPVSALVASFPGDKKLCPVACFKQYLTATSNCRTTIENKPNSLFISYIKPHRPVTPSTIARWIRDLLAEAGINTAIFKAHSVRGASTSAAANASVPMEEILKMANWSTESTFQKFYYKPVLNTNFGRAVLAQTNT